VPCCSCHDGFTGHMTNAPNNSLRPWGPSGYINGTPAMMGRLPHHYQTCSKAAHGNRFEPCFTSAAGCSSAPGYNCAPGYAPALGYGSPPGYNSPRMAAQRPQQASPVSGNSSPRRNKAWKQGGQGKAVNRRGPAAQGATTATNTQVSTA
jgi:hypothetical protein